jgi:hypothetical protein
MMLTIEYDEEADEVVCWKRFYRYRACFTTCSDACVKIYWTLDVDQLAFSTGKGSLSSLGGEIVYWYVMDEYASNMGKFRDLEPQIIPQEDFSMIITSSSTLSRLLMKRYDAKCQTMLISNLPKFSLKYATLPRIQK